ncbi:hypothetical protein ACJJTC_007668 [Scirpophaga incertulas]
MEFGDKTKRPQGVSIPPVGPRKAAAGSQEYLGLAKPSSTLSNSDICEPVKSGPSPVSGPVDGTKRTEANVGKTSALTTTSEVADASLVSEESDFMSETSVASASNSATHFVRRKRARETSACGEDLSDDLSSEDISLTLRKAPARKGKRGRGRPPTTGEYIRPIMTKAQSRRQERLALQLEAEKEIAEMEPREVRTISHTYAATTSAADVAPLEESGDEPTHSVTERIARTLDIVLLVAEKSSNLKGTFVKALKNAVNHLREDAKTLAERTLSEETVCLQQANSRLERELKAQSERIGELEAHIHSMQQRSLPATPPAPTNPAMTALAPHDIEELENRLMGRMVARLNARLEGLEPRLNPEPRLRPSLQHERRAEAFSHHTVQESTPSAPGVSKGGKNQKKSAAEKPTAKEPRALPPPPLNTEEVWSTVVKRGQRRKQRIAGQLLASTTTPKQQPPPLPKKKVPPLQPKLRAPKTAAVVITLQPGAEEKGHTYGQILAVARAKINLSELGIEGVRFRRALTGAAVLLLAGSNREGCALDLAKALKLVIDPAIARVSIPSKTAELLISGLDQVLSMDFLPFSLGCEYTLTLLKYFK